MTNAEEAAALLRRECHGVLSTHSVDAPGYPFGSVVPYCLDRAGRPVILISRIAQHTRNIWSNPKVSLLVSEADADDVQVAARVTYLADAVQVQVPDEEIAARYYRYFPQSLDYHRIHDFDFYRLEGARVRYIGGFGRIHWLTPAQVDQPNPFDEKQEAGMIAHMNADHADAVMHYWQRAGLEPPAEMPPVMAGIDACGFHLLAGARLARIEFDAPVSTPMEVRQAMVKLAKTA